MSASSANCSFCAPTSRTRCRCPLRSVCLAWKTMRIWEQAAQGQQGMAKPPGGHLSSRNPRRHQGGRVSTAASGTMRSCCCVRAFVLQSLGSAPASCLTFAGWSSLWTKVEQHSGNAACASVRVQQVVMGWRVHLIRFLMMLLLLLPRNHSELPDDPAPPFAF